jgi:hypothetical protein
MKTDHPYANEMLAAKRLLGDKAADDFINEVFKDQVAKIELRDWLATLSDNVQFDTLPQAYYGYPFITQANRLPGWADVRLMREGSAFFIAHSQTIMTLLGLLSLPYCYTAANGAMVLYQSERMRNDTTKRLYETAAFVWEVMAPDAFTKDGKAFAAILKVRLMHAAVRYYTLKSGKWDNKWGVPINQEDMAGTNLSFSLIVIRGLRKMGFAVSAADQHAFMHLWNVIGHLSGLHQELLPDSPKQAQVLDTIIGQREFKASEHGQELASRLTDHIISINRSKATDNDILGLMRYLLGKNVADMLNISAPELPYYKLSLIKATNLLKSFKPRGDSQTVYREAYRKFKLQEPVEKELVNA